MALAMTLPPVPSVPDGGRASDALVEVIRRLALRIALALLLRGRLRSLLRAIGNRAHVIHLLGPLALLFFFFLLPIHHAPPRPSPRNPDASDSPKSAG